MIELVCTAKKWGDSLGVIIPKDLAVKEKINVKDLLVVRITKKRDLTKIFGKLRTNRSVDALNEIANEGE